MLLIAALGRFFILYFLIVYTELCAVDSFLGFFFSLFCFVFHTEACAADSNFVCSFALQGLF